MIRTAFKKCIKSITKTITTPIMKWIAWYIGIILLSTFLYMVGWCVLWFIHGKPDIIELRAFLHEIVSAPWIAMVGAVAQYFVDKDNDNIPDILEKKTPPPPMEERTKTTHDTR